MQVARKQAPRLKSPHSCAARGQVRVRARQKCAVHMYPSGAAQRMRAGGAAHACVHVGSAAMRTIEPPSADASIWPSVGQAVPVSGLGRCPAAQRQRRPRPSGDVEGRHFQRTPSVRVRSSADCSHGDSHVGSVSPAATRTRTRTRTLTLTLALGWQKNKPPRRGEATPNTQGSRLANPSQVSHHRRSMRPRAPLSRLEPRE